MQAVHIVDGRRIVMEPYTVMLTSCGRFDLLELTLASLLPRLEGMHTEYFGYSFNSGFRRMHHYRKFTSMADMPVEERNISYCFKRLRYIMGYLEELVVRYIGDRRHNARR